MKDEDRTQEQIIKELRRRIAELEKSESLRNRAEKTLRLQTENLQELSAENVQSHLHELQVHQIELEMQNEELRRLIIIRATRLLWVATRTLHPSCRD